MRDFKVNNLITLKFQNHRTNIYIKGQKLNQRKFTSLKDIGKFDEVVSKLNDALAKTPQGFKNQCSNFQRWAENDYNRRILNSFIAFPLLRRLFNLNDSTAIKVYKEEVAMKFLTGNYYYISYMLNNGFLNLLSKEELDAHLQKLDYTRVRNPEKLKKELTNLVVLKTELLKALKKEIEGKFYGYDEDNKEKYFKFLSKIEIRNAYQEFDFSKLNHWTLREVIPFLNELAENGVLKAVDLLKEKLIHMFVEGSIGDIIKVKSYAETVFDKDELALIGSQKISRKEMARKHLRWTTGSARSLL